MYLGLGLIIAAVMIAKEREKSFISKILLFLIGVLFGFGLMMAGMSQRGKIYGFLELNRSWDPSLLFVLMTGVIINAVTFNLIIIFMYSWYYSGTNPCAVIISRTLMER